MSFKLTGYAEIDEQHSILDSLVEELQALCSLQSTHQDPQCADCSASLRETCSTHLRKILADLGAFLLGHNTYEEKLMELLPDSPKCQRHIKHHKQAHRFILKQLKDISAYSIEHSPRTESLNIFRILDAWKGGHIMHFDSGLADYLAENRVPEINFDDELVKILDEYVFHNRPKPKNTQHDPASQKKKKLETLGRYEKLSQAQKKVFWLLIGGMKTSEIEIELDISRNTVKSHRAAVYRKMNVNSLFDLITLSDYLK
jgi:DNA-binding CsgD family transcriptional regulator/hemerythrin